MAELNILVVVPKIDPWRGWRLICVNGAVRYAGPTPSFERTLEIVAGKMPEMIDAPTQVVKTLESVSNKTSEAFLRMPPFAEDVRSLRRHEDVASAQAQINRHVQSIEELKEKYGI